MSSRPAAATLRPTRGFTLLEVLVALAVVAIALAALARAASQAIETQGALEERSLAVWVADRVLAEIQLEATLSPGRRQGQDRLGNRDWHWDALVQPTPGGELMRIDVAVYAERSRSTPLLTHTGFSRP